LAAPKNRTEAAAAPRPFGSRHFLRKFLALRRSRRATRVVSALLFSRTERMVRSIAFGFFHAESSVWPP
jgi:hypothetical protein